MSRLTWIQAGVSTAACAWLNAPAGQLSLEKLYRNCAGLRMNTFERGLQEDPGVSVIPYATRVSLFEGV